MIRCLLILFFTVCRVCLSAQDYTVSLDDRDSAINITNRAVRKIHSKEYNQAIRLIIDAVNYDSTFRGVYTVMYNASVAAKNFSPEVKGVLGKGNRIFNDDDEISFYLAEIYRMNNEIDSALNLYTHSINLSKINGEDFDLVYLYYFNRGNCFLKKEQYQLAIEDYDYSLKLKPNNANVLSNRGVCFYRIKENDKACDDWKKSSELGNSISYQYFKSHCK